LLPQYVNAIVWGAVPEKFGAMIWNHAKIAKCEAELRIEGLTEKALERVPGLRDGKNPAELGSDNSIVRVP